MLTHPGTVVEHRKNNYLVDTDTGEIEASPRGTINRRSSRPRVGDSVTVSCPLSHNGKGIITEVHPRKNLLFRPAIANVDQVVLITTLREPALSVAIVDRFLFNLAVLNVEVAVVFNKDDLITTDDLREYRDQTVQIYRDCGFACAVVSAADNSGMDTLHDLCHNRTSTFAGLSGVGKSTLLNRLLPGIDLRTAELSKAIERGTHTTTSALLLKLPGGGYLADTPGFAWIDTPFVPDDEVELYFPELKIRIGSCRFNNCLHVDEPGCAVVGAVERGQIANSRYWSYRAILESMTKHRDRYRADKHPRTGGGKPHSGSKRPRNRR